jgi:uncharacterized protein YqiB (DUF1249 family)
MAQQLYLWMRQRLPSFYDDLYHEAQQASVGHTMSLRRFKQVWTRALRHLRHDPGVLETEARRQGEMATFYQEK